MQPQSIDDIIARLESIIDDAVARGDRIGYFAALYNRVTLAVRDGIRTGQFQDGPRMERLDVTFATRFLDALSAWRAGQLPSRVWLEAFEATLSPTPVILQRVLRLKESTDVAANIRSLAQGEFRISVAAAEVATAASIPA